MNVVQIQIQPVEDGAFVVQAVNVDGENASRRFTASNLDELRTKINKLVGVLYTPAAKQQEAPAAPTAQPAAKG